MNRKKIFVDILKIALEQLKASTIFHTQIALVLLNLSFEEFNLELLSKSIPIMQFIFLCMQSQYSALRQAGLDLLGNLSSHVSR